MNKSLAIIVAVGLALGCDDPAVQDRAENVLEHGVVTAALRCEFSFTFDWSGSQPGPVALDVFKLQDGSAMFQYGQRKNGQSSNRTVTEFCPRSEACAQDVKFTLHAEENGSDNPVVFQFAGGDVVAIESGPEVSPSPQTIISNTIDTYCTGFNLEAFD